jgi:ribonuclease-3
MNFIYNICYKEVKDLKEEKLLRIQSKLQYMFRDVSILKIALTHKSYAYEDSNVNKIEYNERIEFLGDAILEHIISDLLFFQVPKLSEGQMTKMRSAIVCEASLSKALKRIDGQEYIYLGKCEKTTNGKTKDAIIADAFEALLGAIYIDGGYDVAKHICLSLLENEINTVLSGGVLNIDYKTKLQEKLQKKGNVKIEYVTVKESGPEHEKTFEVELFFNDNKIGEGIGKSKKYAEQNAAKNALERSNKA